MIEATHIRKSFGAVKAVEDVSFVAKPGQITALLGPNGAGKTTTLRMITAAIPPDGGSVRVDGVDASESPLRARERIGLLSDNRGLYTRLTSRENIRFYGELQGVPAVIIEERIARLATMLDMGEILDRRTDGFSLGQRMKVAIARTIIHDPPNILLDEPTTGLDVMATRALRSVIRRLRDEGKCIILSTHVMQEVVALSDRVVILSKGKVCAEGACDELLAKTKEKSFEDAFVALMGTAEGVLS